MCGRSPGSSRVLASLPPHERLLNVERSYHYVRAVIPAMSSKPLGIYPHVCVSTRSEIGPHILRHLQTSQHRRTVCSDGCFSILDHASTTIQLKIKEAIHIQWEQPTLNHQLYHVNSKLSTQLHTLFCFYCLFCPMSILLYTSNKTLYKSEPKTTEELSKHYWKKCHIFSYLLPLSHHYRLPLVFLNEQQFSSCREKAWNL